MSLPAPLMPEVDFILDEMPDLHDRIAELRKVGPVVPLKAFGEPAWFLLDFADVDHVFRDKKIFDVTRYNLEVATPIVGKTLLAMKEQEHSLNRGLMNPAFMPGKVRSYVESILEPTIHELLDRIEGKELVDIKEAFCKPFPFTVITKLMDIPVENEERLIHLASTMLSYMFDPEGARAANREFDAFINPIIEERRRNPGDDLISQLIMAEIDGDKLDEEPVLAFLRTLYPAGGHSTSLNTASAVYAALANPEAREMVLRSDKERWAVVQEALRWEPALGVIPRLMTGPTEVQGVHITGDQMVYMLLTAANNDPKVFPDPRRFDPSRKNVGSHITFGRHEHMCLGRHLAMREIDMALRVLFERFPKMELVTDQKVTFSGTWFRTCEEIWVRPYGN